MSKDFGKASDRPARSGEVAPGFAGEDMYDVSDGNDSSGVPEDVSSGEDVVDELESPGGVPVEFFGRTMVGSVG